MRMFPTVGIGTGIGHRQNALPGVLQRKVLVLELGTYKKNSLFRW